MPIKPLSFKGDKKPVSKKRKAAAALEGRDDSSAHLTASSTKGPTADPAPTDDDTWVSADVPTDLSGPVVLVLATTPTPAALACDDTGAVFASPLENMIEGDPATAEPHDVRQVWVATQIPGAAAGEVGGLAAAVAVVVSFKGSNGRYLGCDQRGFLKAEAVAVSPAEGFIVSTVDAQEEEKGKFFARTGPVGGNEEEGEAQKQRYISVEQPREGNVRGWEIRGDGEAAAATSMLRIRMQARFKPSLKATNEMKAKKKISRRELEAAVGRPLGEDDVKRLKRARENGTYYEAVLDVRVKGKHDKFAS